MREASCRVERASILLIVCALLSACSGRPVGQPVRLTLPATSTRAASAPIANAPTLAPTFTAVPTATPAPTPIPTPAPTLRRLTEPGCCTQPAWLPNGRQVVFVDKPTADAPAGFYVVDVMQDSAPTLLTDWMVTYSPDFLAAAYPEGDVTVIERLDSGQRWRVDTQDNPPALSPDKTRIVWQDTAESGPYNARQTDVWLAELGGDENPPGERVLSMYGGGLAAWFPDSQRVLISARPSLTIEQRALAVFSFEDRSAVELARAERISGITLSPGGTWAAFFVSFAEDDGENGIWVVRTDGALRRKLDVFGSYQWRDDGRLLVIPMEPGAASDVVWQVNAADGAATRLTDPAITPFKIAGGDWRVSPDGKQMVFVNAQDKALWLLTW